MLYWKNKMGNKKINQTQQKLYQLKHNTHFYRLSRISMWVFLTEIESLFSSRWYYSIQFAVLFRHFASFAFHDSHPFFILAITHTSPKSQLILWHPITGSSSCKSMEDAILHYEEEEETPGTWDDRYNLDESVTKTHTSTRFFQQILLKFCTEHCSVTAMLCAQFLKDSVNDRLDMKFCGFFKNWVLKWIWASWE